MKSFEKMGETPEQPKEEKEMEAEKEQTREEVESSIKKAFEEYLLCNLVIENNDGQESFVPDCLVEDVDGEYLMISWVTDDGDLGDVIPLDLSSVKSVNLKGPYQEKE